MLTFWLTSDEFAADNERIIRWKAFLKKIKWKEEIPFFAVMQIIKERLQPLASRYWESNVNIHN